MNTYALLSYADLREKKGIPFSRVHIWRMIEAGDFPKPIHLSKQRKAWIESEIDDWIAAKVAERE